RENTMNKQSSTATENRVGRPAMILALVPWVAFTALTQHASLQVGAVAALVVSVLVALPSVRAGKPKTLELGAVATFIGFVLAAFVADADTAQDLVRYGRGIAAGVVSLIVFASLLFTPFTEQYAREQVSPAVWSSVRFKEHNRKLTAMWGLIFAAMIPFHI